MLSALLAAAVAALSVVATATAASAPTPGKLRGVVENSGVCETTTGVYQASGYGDISSDGSVWCVATYSSLCSVGVLTVGES